MKEGVQDLWNDLDVPLTQAQAQAQAQTSPSLDLRRLIPKPNIRNLTNYSQTGDYSSVPEGRNLADRPRASTDKRRIWRNRGYGNGSSTESESEGEVESHGQGGYYSKCGSIASLGKYDVKRERRVMANSYDEETNFSEQVELIKHQINKRKLSHNESTTEKNHKTF